MSLGQQTKTFKITVKLLNGFHMEIRGIAKRIKLFRESKGLGIDSMAKKLCINISSAYDIESYDNEFVDVISVKDILNLCLFFETSPKQLFGDLIYIDNVSPKKAVSVDQFIGRILDAVDQKKLFCRSNSVLAEKNVSDWYVDGLLSRKGVFESCIEQVSWVCSVLDNISWIDTIEKWHIEKELDCF